MTKKILLIEDDKELSANINTILSEESFEVDIAVNGSAGIKLAISNDYDLILCDILLPGINGYNVLNILKEEGITRTTPFIYISAKVEKDDLRRGMDLGADDYIFKPFKIQDLINAVQTRIKKFEEFKSRAEDKKDIIEESHQYSLEDKLFLNMGSKPAVIKVGNIKVIIADNQYSKIYLSDEFSLLVRKSLSAWENSLPPKSFCRIHRSTIVNLNHLQKFEKCDSTNYKVAIKDLSKFFVVSKKYASKLKKIF